MKLEVCCADLVSLRAAVEGGAHRVELCQALGLDGLTPSTGMIEMAVESGIVVHVLIRPREGNFVYSQDEVECMARDIRMARSLGVHGVVIGALTEEGDIDVATCQRLVGEAGEMRITFHRAFDVCRDPLRAFEQIVSLGCDRLLTSGHERTAEEGIPLIRQLVDMRKMTRRGEEFIVMPGSGVNVENAARILKETGAKEIHGSLRKDGHTDVGMVRSVVATIS